MPVRKGFSGILILIVGALIITFGIYIFSAKNSSPINEIKITTPEDTINTYTNDNLGFSFKYDKNLKVQEDSEELFNQRNAGITQKVGDYRKNFQKYVGYEPGKFLGAVAVLDETENYDKNPLTIWVFENPDNLSPEGWYKRYWYYPFIWGDFTDRSNQIAPNRDATISGQLAKYSVVSYQPNSPKFMYLSKDDKMFLFRTIGEDGDKILENFRFLPRKCPEIKGINCMPIIADPEYKKMCKQENLRWISNNCPDIEITH